MSLSIPEFTELNVVRCNAWHDINDWSPMEWGCAMAGEAGECCDALKKLGRIEHGIDSKNNPADLEKARQAVATEVGDTFVYLNLICARVGIDMEKAIADTFNRVSEREGLPQRVSLTKA